MKNKVNEPSIGAIVKHTGWRFEDNKNYPCDVLIKSGKYMSNGGVSNFWYWQRVLDNGALSETEHGYGSFEESENKYEIETVVKRVN